MGIEQVQGASVNEALKAMADFRARANIQATKKAYAEPQTNPAFSAETQPTQLLPRTGRYVNVWA